MRLDFCKPKYAFYSPMTDAATNLAFFVSTCKHCVWEKLHVRLQCCLVISVLFVLTIPDNWYQMSLLVYLTFFMIPPVTNLPNVLPSRVLERLLLSSAWTKYLASYLQKCPLSAFWKILMCVLWKANGLLLYFHFKKAIYMDVVVLKCNAYKLKQWTMIHSHIFIWPPHIVAQKNNRTKCCSLLIRSYSRIRFISTCGILFLYYWDLLSHASKVRWNFKISVSHKRELLDNVNYIASSFGICLPLYCKFKSDWKNSSTRHDRVYLGHAVGGLGMRFFNKI